MVAEEGGQMKYGDPEYQRQIEVIRQIPSNKVNAESLDGYSEADMLDFERRHLIELTQLAMRENPAGQKALISGCDIRIVMEVIGDYITRQEEKEKALQEITK